MVEEGKIGEGQTLSITEPLDTWSSFVQGSSARVFKCQTNHSGVVTNGAIKIMRKDQGNYALPLFYEEAKILEVMKDIDGVVSLLECGFIKSIDIDTLLNNYDKKSINIDGEVRCFINDTTSFLELLEEFTGNGWLPYLILEPLPIEQNLLKLTDLYRESHLTFPLDQAQEIFTQACFILEAAHNKHIIYRDHKILHYHWDERNHRLKLIDWNAGKIYLEGLSDEFRRMDLMEFVAGMVYRVLTNNNLAVSFSLPEDIKSSPLQRMHPVYSAKWRFDDRHIPEELRTVVEIALQGKIKSARILGELFQDPSKIKNISPEILNQYDDIQNIPNYFFQVITKRNV